MQDLKQLKLTERRKPLKADFDFRQQTMEKWIADLPRGSVGETGQLIYEKLKELNSLNIKFQDRMSCLELLREPAQYVTASMKKHFISTTFPISQRAWKTAVACRSIHAAMAEGYKIAAYDISSANILFYDKKLLTTAIHRASCYIAQVLLNCYQVYEAYLYDYWKDLNNLYSYAEHKKLHDTLIVDKMHQYIHKTTIRDEYSRSLLLFMAEPDHLRQGEVSKISVNLERWFPHVQLSPLLNCSEDSMAGKTVINLHSEFPPRTLRALPEEDDLSAFRYIDVSKLLTVVEEELKNAEKSISNTLISLNLEKESLPASLINRILESWSGTKKRRFSRQRINKKVKLSVGLNNIHQLISDEFSSGSNIPASLNNDELDKDDPFITAANFEADEVDDVNLEQPDVWDMVYPTTKPAFILQHEDEQTDSAGSHSESIYSSDSWTMINQSPEGFCLTCVENGGENLQVGELIGVNSQESTSSGWSSAGMVRWIRSYGENGTVVGGAMLSPNTLAVGIKMFSADQEEDEYQRALLFSEITALKRPASLVLPALASRPGQLVKLHIPGKKDRQIKLTRLLGSNHLVNQFLFVPMGEVTTKDAAPVETNEVIEKSAFDDVWKVL